MDDNAEDVKTVIDLLLGAPLLFPRIQAEPVSAKEVIALVLQLRQVRALKDIADMLGHVERAADALTNIQDMLGTSTTDDALRVNVRKVDEHG